jgi:hypothetical protein
METIPVNDALAEPKPVTAAAGRRLAGVAGVPLAAAAVALGLSVLLVVLGPPAGDAAAHLYRAFLVREGALVWDNLWYGGHYPLLSYSVLYYFPAAALGSVTVAVAASVAAAWLFASIATREWGAAGRWPALAFAVLAAGPVFTGTYAYALGLAFALASLRLLQATHRSWAVVCAGLALGASPLAFLFLVLAIAAVALARRPARRETVAVGSGLVLLGGLELALLRLFPAEGRYGFRAQELGLALAVAALGIGLSLRTPRARVVAAFFALWALAVVVAFLVPSPFGSTVTRVRYVALPLVLVPAALAGYRPRWLAAAGVTAALAYTVSPYAAVATGLTDTRAAHGPFWQPALAFLQAHASPGFRVDVVPTFDNWEAYYVPHAGFALARGWYRQLDLDRNPVLYEPDLTAAEYRTWLRSVGVEYVHLPRVPLDRLAAERQAAILGSGRSGLVRVYAGRDWTIFRLPSPTPILTGPAPARLDELGHDRLAGSVSAPGSYLLRVRYMRYWRVAAGDVCLERAPSGMTRLVARGAGRFELRVAGAGGIARAIAGSPPAACP